MLQVHQQLQELPEQWNNTKKIAITVKQQVAPLQTNEVANIRRKTASFDVQQHTFRETFRSIGPFFYNCPNAYTELDDQHEVIFGMEKEMIALNESASLFEVRFYRVAPGITGYYVGLSCFDVNTASQICTFCIRRTVELESVFTYLMSKLNC